MVKSLRTTHPVRGALIALLALGSGGCAVHLVGLVGPDDDRGTVLSTLEGQQYRLSLHGEARPMRYLDGHLCEVDGTTSFKRVRVGAWTVLEGLHGLPVWVGVLEWRGVQIGMHDRNTGAYVFLDEEGADVLAPYVGKPVLVEGYVEGAHRVRVVYYRVLADEEDPRPPTGGTP